MGRRERAKLMGGNLTSWERGDLNLVRKRLIIPPPAPYATSYLQVRSWFAKILPLNRCKRAMKHQRRPIPDSGRSN